MSTRRRGGRGRGNSRAIPLEFSELDIHKSFNAKHESQQQPGMLTPTPNFLPMMSHSPLSPAPPRPINPAKRTHSSPGFPPGLGQLASSTPIFKQKTYKLSVHEDNLNSSLFKFGRQGKVNKQHGHIPGQAKLNLYCSACNRAYDLNSRVPLMLECNHLMCEDCLRSKITKGVTATCAECNISVNIKRDNDFNVRDRFPVNYYLIGKLQYYRAERGSGMNSQCAPVNLPNLSLFGDQGSMNDRLKKKNNKDEVLFSLSPCPTHKGNPQDFYCNTCAASFCTYCILDAHKDHNFKQVTKLAEEDREKFNGLLNGCRKKLAQLQKTQMDVARELPKFKSKTDTTLVKDISTCFYAIHGKLQMIEERLLQQASSLGGKLEESLQAIDAKLNENINLIETLVASADAVSEQQCSNVCQKNIGLLMQRMMAVEALPHMLQSEDSSLKGNTFRFDDFTADLDKYFHLEVEPAKVFKLVAGDVEIADDNVLENPIGRKEKTPVGNLPKAQYLQLIQTSPDSNPTNSSIESELLNMVPIDFQENTMQNVYVTQIISPEKFYVQLTKHLKNIKDLNKRLRHLVEKQYVSLVDNPKPNQMYLAIYGTGFSISWRRGIVKTYFPDESECLVYFIDYGNCSNVLIEDLRTITDEIAGIPPFAYECKLFDLVELRGQSWNASHVKFMEKLLKGANVVMEIKNITKTCFEVDLHISTSTTDFSMRNSLVFGGHAGSNSDEDVSVVHCLPKQFEYLEEPLKMGGIPVRILTVVDAVTFFVENVSNEDYIQQQKVALQLFYNKKANCQMQKIETPTINTGVAVRFPNTNDTNSFNWHRGLVLEIYHSDHKMKVVLVDIGREEIVDYMDVFKLNKQFAFFAKLASKVRLADVAFENEVQNQSGISYLNNLKKAGVFYLQVHRQLTIPDVILFDRCAFYDLCINAQIVETVGLISTGFVSKDMEWPRHDAHSETDGTSIVASLLNQSQCAITSADDATEEEDESEGQNLIPVKILHVTNPHCIHLHAIESKDFTEKLNQFDLKFQLYQLTHELVTRDEWNVDEICVAYNKQSRQYWRAKVTQRLPENEYEVVGIDFGRSFVLYGDAMGELTKEFRDVPEMALVVRLYGIKPLGKQWPLTTTDYLRDLIAKKSNIFMTRVKNTSNEKISPVIIWTRKTLVPSAFERTKIITQNVNRMICKQGLGALSSDWTVAGVCIPDSTKSARSSTKNESESSQLLPFSHRRDELKGWLPARCIDECTFKAIATYVDEIGNIYFHDLKDSNTLLELEQAIYESSKFVKPVLNVTWEVGNICTVKYHLNQKYYRGEVVGLNDEEQELRVRMIDYGNVEDCRYDEVWKQVYFADVPRVAKKVRLYNVRFPSELPTRLIDDLHVVLVEKVIDLEIMDQASSRRPASAKIFCGKVDVNSFVQGEIDKLQAKVAQSQKAAHVRDADESDDDVIIERVIRGGTSQSRANYSPIRSGNKLPKSRASPGYIPRYKYIDLPAEDTFLVTVVNIFDISMVMFELNGRAHSPTQFEILQKDIAKRWSEQYVVPLENLRNNHACIAKYNADQLWYRARAVQHSEKWFIHFVDYGNVEFATECEEIRKIKREWLESPVEQFHATLSDHHRLTSNFQAVSQHFDSYINSTMLAKVTSREPLSIQLFDPNTGSLAYEELLTK